MNVSVPIVAHRAWPVLRAFSLDVSGTGCNADDMGCLLRSVAEHAPGLRRVALDVQRNDLPAAVWSRLRTDLPATVSGGSVCITGNPRCGRPPPDFPLTISGERGAGAFVAAGNLEDETDYDGMVWSA